MGNEYSTVGKEFNRTFGSNITHLANAYGQGLSVTFVNRYTRITGIDLSTGHIEFSDENAISTKFYVPNRTVHKYPRSNTDEYMTLVCTNTRKVICENYPVPANKSYIVTQAGAIMEQKYGSSNFFEDVNGFIW